MKLMTLTSIKNIGVIGLGRIGTAIASNILKSDFNLVVYNRTAIFDAEGVSILPGIFIP
jgi:3-hydroxyisobutyrate dehydrogenase-like beta-hydroxyacid dehydrogenase